MDLGFTLGWCIAFDRHFFHGNSGKAYILQILKFLIGQILLWNQLHRIAIIRIISSKTRKLVCCLFSGRERGWGELVSWKRRGGAQTQVFSSWKLMLTNMYKEINPMDTKENFFSTLWNQRLISVNQANIEKDYSKQLNRNTIKTSHIWGFEIQGRRRPDS